MPDPTKDSVLYNLRYTPVLDFLRIGFTARLDPLRPLEAAALPIPIKQLIERVVQRTRLWRLEKLDVLTELIAHFADGIASGAPAEDLIQAFGDEGNAAQLIRRAKRRNRPLYWHSLRAAALFTLGTLAIALPLMLISTYVQHARWNTMTRQIDAQIDAVKVDAEARRKNRSVLRGTAMPGNPWDEYNVALGEPFPDIRDVPSVSRYMTGNISNAEEKAKVEKLISTNAWRFEHLHLGAQRANGQLPHDWSKKASIFRTRWLANLAAAQAQRLADSGQSQEAENILLDVVALGQDLSTNAGLQAEVFKSPNQLVREWDNLTALLEVGRGGRAMLRLLRATLAVLTTGKVPVLSDPYGTNILSSSNADGVVIWSAGRAGASYGYDQPGIVVKIPRQPLETPE